MYRRIDDFLRNWEYEAASTSKMIGEMTEAARGQAVAPRHRTLDRLAWHVAQSIPEMMSMTGLSVTGVDPDAPVPEESQKSNRPTMPRAHRSRRQ